LILRTLATGHSTNTGLGTKRTTGRRCKTVWKSSSRSTFPSLLIESRRAWWAMK
jgi:hypothetical protein